MPSRFICFLTDFCVTHYYVSVFYTLGCGWLHDLIHCSESFSFRAIWSSLVCHFLFSLFGFFFCAFEFYVSIMVPKSTLCTICLVLVWVICRGSTWFPHGGNKNLRCVLCCSSSKTWNFFLGLIKKKIMSCHVSAPVYKHLYMYINTSIKAMNLYCCQKVESITCGSF